MSVVAAPIQEFAEREEVVSLARALARRELAPRALELDEGRPAALDAAWGQIAEAGFDRALLAVEDGGVGLDPGSLLLCLEEIASGDAGIALLVLLSNAALSTLPDEALESVGEGERWALLPAPDKRLATAARIAVSANGDGPTAATGSLCPAPGALGAGGLVLVTGGREPAVVALSAETPGLRIEPCEPLLGLRAAAPARITLSDAKVEAAVPPAEAPTAVEAAMALLRAGCGAIARGVARRAFELAAEYAHARIQGGVPIVRHDAVREMLVAMAIRLQAPQQIGTDPRTAIVAKISSSDDAAAIATDAVQVFGGAGYMRETGVEKLMRDAKCLQLWPEPNWIAGERFVGILHPPPPDQGPSGS
jgi:alkylation response protein AidB-like acyl-CoA dehydrogenase